ncbi:MAG: aminotransferase class III-fold pyridoxal phosphate-dependent enzyme, partial [Bdellovibrionales bacterium]
FFSDNGSTAVEVALKMSLQSWAQKGETQRQKFLSFTHSYHGDTVGAMSVSAPSLFTKPYKPFLFSMEYCNQGHLSTDTSRSFYEDFERKLEKHHKNLAAVIIEPLIQGAGGMVMWPKDALEHICKLTKQAGAYLIFDEIMTGFGRTGTTFALEQISTPPDLLCLSKGLTGGTLPLALTISTEEIYQDFLSPQKEKAFFHGHSFTGNPISCAAALSNLKLLRKKKSALEKKWREIEGIHKERSQSLKDHPLVQDVRYKGLVAAIETQNSKGYASLQAEKWMQKALEKGVFLRPLGGILYILPPYCISKEDLHKTWDVIGDLL